MNNQKTIQKAVINGLLIAAATTLIIFGFVFTLMVSDDLFSVARFEKALNTTGSYFGGVTTLAAACIAARFVMSWKDQTKYNEQLTLMASIVTEARNLYLQINELRNNQEIAIYLANTTKFILDNDPPPDVLAQYIEENRRQHQLPSLLHVFNSRKYLLDLQFNLRLYANNDTALSNIINSLSIIDAMVDIYMAQLKLVYTDQSMFGIKGSGDALYSWLQRVFNLSYSASMVIQQFFPKIDYRDLKVMELILDREINILHGDITEYRDALDK